MERILCLGDSNTYGYDPRSFLGSRYPKEISWTGRLEREGREVLNCGQNGQSIYRPAAFPWLAPLLTSRGKPDRILLMLGTNDLLQGAKPEDCGKSMETLLNFLLEQAQGARLLLIAPPPMQPGDWVETRELIDRSRRLADVYRDVAEKLGVDFADAGSWDVELCFDGVHFSPAGHAAFARGLVQILEERNTV